MRVFSVLSRGEYYTLTGPLGKFGPANKAMEKYESWTSDKACPLFRGTPVMMDDKDGGKEMVLGWFVSLPSGARAIAEAQR